MVSISIISHQFTQYKHLTSFSRRFCNRSFNIIRLPLYFQFCIFAAAIESETKLTVMHRTIRKPTQDILVSAVGDEVTE